MPISKRCNPRGPDGRFIEKLDIEHAVNDLPLAARLLNRAKWDYSEYEKLQRYLRRAGMSQPMLNEAIKLSDVIGASITAYDYDDQIKDSIKAVSDMFSISKGNILAKVSSGDIDNKFIATEGMLLQSGMDKVYQRELTTGYDR